MTSIRLAGMTVELDGEGPAIVMLHGLGGTSNSFQAMVPALAGFRVVRPICREPDDHRRRRNGLRSRAWSTPSQTRRPILASTGRTSSGIRSVH